MSRIINGAVYKSSTKGFVNINGKKMRKGSVSHLLFLISAIERYWQQTPEQRESYGGGGGYLVDKSRDNLDKLKQRVFRKVEWRKAQIAKKRKKERDYQRLKAFAP